MNLMSSGLPDPDQSVVGLSVAMNWRMLLFTTIVALSTTLLFGLTPAFRATTISPAAAMNAGSFRIAGARGRLGAALVTVQVALSGVLLVGAGLFVRTVQNLRTLDMGFRHGGVLLVNIDARRAGYQAARLRVFNQEALDFASGLPGVRVASLASVTPL